MYELIDKVKEINPLVVHYTNEVTINDCANVTLALGASPIMSYSYEEVEEVIGISSAVVINIGTMNSSRLDLFVQAGKAANKYNIKDCRYICACCIKRQKTTGQLPDGTKLEWEYIN